MTRRTGWLLGRWVVLLLTGAFALLLIEVRSLHQEVLQEHAIAWTPIVYSGVMVVASAVGIALWDRGGRRALFSAFVPALVIGPVGFWFHNAGRPLEGLQRELAAWTRPVGAPEDAEGSHQANSKPSQNGGSHRKPHEPEKHERMSTHRQHGHAHEGGAEPPALAPLAIAGIGLMGILACARRFQPESAVADGE